MAASSLRDYWLAERARYEAEDAQVRATALIDRFLDSLGGPVTKTIGNPGQQRMLRISEVADLLSLSERTIRHYCRQGRFPNAKQIGRGIWLIPKADVEQFEYVAVATTSAPRPAALNPSLNAWEMVYAKKT